MRPTLLLPLLMLSCCSFSQSLQTARSKFIEFNGDLCKIHLAPDGGISDDCRGFIRVGRLHPTIINVDGEFSDYDLNGNIMFRAFMSNNQLNGQATFFYPDGKIRETGKYSNNKRDSVWVSYHPNGVVEKILIYKGEEVLVWEASTKGGKKAVSNGNGDFRTEVDFGRYSLYSHIAKGPIKNGKRHGEWAIISPSSYEKVIREVYNEGQLIVGKEKYSGIEYKTHPQISFVRYSPHENVSLVENHPLCSRQYATEIRYKNQRLHDGFYPMLTRKLTREFPKSSDQWVMVEFIINEADRISDIAVRSSIRDSSVEDFIFSFLKSSYEWEASRARQKYAMGIFFTILFNKGSIIIPANLLYLQNLSKIYYNNNNEVTVAELATHYRMLSDADSKKGFVNQCLEYDLTGNAYMEINYSREGKKEGRFLYDRYGAKIETKFANDKPVGFIPDSLLKAIAQKELFVKSKYIRKREYTKVLGLLDPGFVYEVSVVPIVADPELPPQFPGGMKMLSEFLAHHLILPEEVRIKNVKGSVTVACTVFPNGELHNLTVLKSLGHGCDEAAIEAVYMLPDWLPATKDGRPVAAQIIIEVPFFAP